MREWRVCRVKSATVFKQHAELWKLLRMQRLQTMPWQPDLLWYHRLLRDLALSPNTIFGAHLSDESRRPPPSGDRRRELWKVKMASVQSNR